MNFIDLGNHKIEVSVSMGSRMVKQSDTKKLLQLKDSEVSEHFIDAKFVTDTLFKKIYESNDATVEQKIIFEALCIVGIYSLIDEVCKVDLRGVSYIKEFNSLIASKVGIVSDQDLSIHELSTRLFRCKPSIPFDYYGTREMNELNEN